MLRVTDLHSGYGRIPIVSGLSLHVAKGEFVGILGHNGMGKTTLLRTLMGFLPEKSGTVVFEGRTITHLPPYERARAGLGLVPQGREIFPALSVLENLRMGCAASRGDDAAIIDELLDEFPRLKPLLPRRGGALSCGEQQLLAIARCLCARPRLILLDEPTEGIQPSIVEEIIETLQRLQARGGLTMILVEQDLEFIAALSQRVLVIQKGVITREISPTELEDPELVGEFVGMAH
jgi:branched-chain amino acid transport system ATP-binding protein